MEKCIYWMTGILNTSKDLVPFNVSSKLKGREFTADWIDSYYFKHGPAVRDTGSRQGHQRQDAAGHSNQAASASDGPGFSSWFSCLGTLAKRPTLFELQFSLL